MTELVVDEIGLEIIKPNQEYVSYYDLVYNGESACPSSSSSLSSASRSISLSSSSASQSSSQSSSSSASASASASASLSKASSTSSVAFSVASPASSVASSGASSASSAASDGSPVASSASSAASSVASSVASSGASSVASSVASSASSDGSSASSDGSSFASSAASSVASSVASSASSAASDGSSFASSIGSSITTLTTYVPCPECTDPYTYTTETVITTGTAPVTVPEVVIGTPVTTLTTYVPCPECTDPYTYTTETVITTGTAPVTVPEVVIGTPVTTLTTYIPCPECTDPYTYTTETVITTGTAPVTVPEVVIGTPVTTLTTYVPCLECSGFYSYRNSSLVSTITTYSRCSDCSVQDTHTTEAVITSINLPVTVSETETGTIVSSVTVSVYPIPTISAAPVSNEPYYYIYIPTPWFNFELTGEAGDHYEWDGERFEIEIDNVSPPSSVYDVMFSEKTVSLDYPFEFEDYATLTFVGSRTDSSPLCIASFVIDATPDAILEKRELLEITLTATVVFPTESSFSPEDSSIASSNGITTTVPSTSSDADKPVASDASESHEPQHYPDTYTTIVYTTEIITTICSSNICTATSIVTVITTDCPVVCKNGDCTTITSTTSDLTTIFSPVTYTTTICEDNKCRESEVTSVITKESELECSVSETLNCEMKSYATETATYTSTERVTFTVETIDSTFYATIYSEETFTHITNVESTVVPPVKYTVTPNPDQQSNVIGLTTVISVMTPLTEISFISTTSSTMKTPVYTLEGAGNKLDPYFTFSFAFLLAIVLFV
ncbi:unnamed protein product [[Candida] boidinii]|nr:unnamed protein product [[Candida] boidinii]